MAHISLSFISISLRKREAETSIVHLEETSERLHIDEGKKSKQIEAMWDPQSPWNSSKEQCETDRPERDFRH